MLDARDLGQAGRAPTATRTRAAVTLRPPTDHEAVARPARPQRGEPLEQPHAGPRQHADVDAVEPRDLAVAGLAQGLEVEPRPPSPSHSRAHP